MFQTLCTSSSESDAGSTSATCFKKLGCVDTTRREVRSLRDCQVLRGRLQLSRVSWAPASYPGFVPHDQHPWLRSISLLRMAWSRFLFCGKVNNRVVILAMSTVLSKMNRQTVRTVGAHRGLASGRHYGCLMVVGVSQTRQCRCPTMDGGPCHTQVCCKSHLATKLASICGAVVETDVSLLSSEEFGFIVPCFCFLLSGCVERALRLMGGRC